MIEWIKLIGGLLGIFVFIWRLYDAFKAYLHIYLTVQYPSTGKFIQLITRIENKNKKSKTIDTAFLLVTPHGTDVIEAMRKIAGNRINFTNDFVTFSRTSQDFIQENTSSL